jgi:hypothetical protein
VKTLTEMGNTNPDTDQARERNLLVGNSNQGSCTGWKNLYAGERNRLRQKRKPHRCCSGEKKNDGTLLLVAEIEILIQIQLDTRQVNEQRTTRD